MDAPQEFHYRLPGRVSGQRPGSHAGSSVGAGQEFVTHMTLFNRPDPRRLDLRASLRTLNEDWLVRVNRQRSGVAVRAIVDVSASMNFGAQRPKLHVAANFVEALGMSAFRVGDAVGMMAFDETERPDLFMPARMSRGVGSIMASALRSARCHSSGGHNPVEGLEEAASHLAGQQGLVFLVSDFHWPLGGLIVVLDLLAHASVVPVVVWDPAEMEPPESNALATLRDAESGARRTLWVRPKLRQDWRQAVARRRAEIDAFFASRSIRPFYVEGAFDADALSRYFFESEAGI
jgi:VWA domain-containing protein